MEPNESNASGLQLPIVGQHDEEPLEATEAPGRTVRGSIDISAVRRRLEERRGKEYWRSFEDFAESEEFQDYLTHEFPDGADKSLDPVSRRNFLKVMSASFALAGLGACVRQPEEKIVPYVKQPEEIIPGKPLFYATSAVHQGYGTGVIVESHMGRPTKIEGNPDHPASLGATDVFAQAAILQMYDPDRSQEVMKEGRISSFGTFSSELSKRLAIKKTVKGEGLRVLTGTITSPTVADQLEQFFASYPNARWHRHEPVDHDAMRAGVNSVLGRDADPIYSFDRATVILSLDADFLYGMPGNVRYARDFIKGRKAVEGTTEFNRLYMIENGFSNTGAMADHRMAVRCGDIADLAGAIAAGLGVPGATAGAAAGGNTEWVNAVVADLRAAGPRALVLVGETQPASVHALAHAINRLLGAEGTTVRYVEPIEARAGSRAGSITELAAEMHAGKVDTLIILGCNPVYTAPVDLRFGKALSKVAFSAHHGAFYDETAWRTHWHIPESHFLESWGDVRSYDGTVSIIQPLIAPIFKSKSATEILGVMNGSGGTTGYDALRAYWQKRVSGNFEKTWRRALHDGVIPSAAVVTPPAMQGAAPTAPVAPQSVPKPPSSRNGLEIVFRPDPNLWDGEFSNNGWMMELPRPVTKLTWDNAAVMSPRTAEKLGVRNEDVVELSYRRTKLKAPVWIVPGHADESVSVYFGFGRDRAGRIGNGVGYNAYALRYSDAPWFGYGLDVKATGDRLPLACTQNHGSMEGRDLLRMGTLEQYRKNPTLYAGEESKVGEVQPSLLPEYDYPDNKWGMVIDLNSCIGCNSCAIACQAENNIPVVGKGQVLVGREMHWIRVDRYFTGEMDSAGSAFQPVPCMQCEHAPCEVVCPTGRHHSFVGRAQRHDVQPLHRDALLFEQLSLQGAPLQLPEVCGHRG